MKSIESSQLQLIIDKIKLNIILTMSEENKSPEYIYEELKKYKLYNDTLEAFKKYISTSFNMCWSSCEKKWEEQISFLKPNTVFELKDFSKDFSMKNNKFNIIQNKNKIVINLDNHIKIPHIDELELAYTILDKNKSISVSSNDAETLLKNMACIQSKLNEITRAINKIAEVINLEINK